MSAFIIIQRKYSYLRFFLLLLAKFLPKMTEKSIIISDFIIIGDFEQNIIIGEVIIKGLLRSGFGF